MELEKSDAVESIEEKLTNQITILTRETRELKELLNHTMNERTLAIEHAHKLMVITMSYMKYYCHTIVSRPLHVITLCLGYGKLSPQYFGPILKYWYS
jgi:hypothetical protein